MKKKPSEKGEMRRRCKAWMDAGAFSNLGSEGRLAAIYVLQVADWRTCEFDAPTRVAAGAMKTHRTSLLRGFQQMLSEGILEVVRPGGPRKPTRYRMKLWSHSVTAEVTPRDRRGHATCPPMVTQCDRRGHVPRTLRSHSVTSAVTQGDHHSVFSSGKQSLPLEEQSGGSGSPPTVPQSAGGAA